MLQVHFPQIVWLLDMSNKYYKFISFVIKVIKRRLLESLKYLGICIKASRKFACDFDYVKAKFYRTFNCSYAKSFTGNSELITIELLRSCCLPVLLYAIESLLPRVCDIDSLNSLTA